MHRKRKTLEKQIEMGDCYEKEVEYPPNTAATCWWLALNACLFHTKRKEFEEYFTSAPTSMEPLKTSHKGYFVKVDDSITKSTDSEIDIQRIQKGKQELYQIFKSVYYFHTYQNDKIKEVFEAINAIHPDEKIPLEENLTTNILNLRTRNAMKSYFNTTREEAKEDGTIQTIPVFTVSSTTIQDAEEYIYKLIDLFDGFNTNIEHIVLKVKDQTKQIKETYTYQNIIQIKGLYNVYDIKLWTMTESGSKNTINDYVLNGKVTPVEEITKQYITTQASTVILKFNPIVIDGRIEKENIQIQKEIEIPLRNVRDGIEALEIESKKFILDSILCYTGGHYYSYMKCDGSENWIYYGAMRQGKLQESFSFEELLEREDILKYTLMLFYTKEEDIVKGEKKEEGVSVSEQGKAEGKGEGAEEGRAETEAPSQEDDAEGKEEEATKQLLTEEEIRELDVLVDEELNKIDKMKKKKKEAIHLALSNQLHGGSEYRDIINKIELTEEEKQDILRLIEFINKIPNDTTNYNQETTKIIEELFASIIGRLSNVVLQ
jgi:hypothetical protein